MLVIQEMCTGVLMELCRNSCKNLLLKKEKCSLLMGV